MKVLDSFWFSQLGFAGTIGVVAVRDIATNEIKFYIGTSVGYSQVADEETIASNGAKFPQSAGFELMPHIRRNVNNEMDEE